ncbi:hypothetical protein PG987_009925 [Apiospora arundinis]
MSRICPAFLRPEAQALLPVPTNRDHVNYYDVTGTKGRGKVPTAFRQSSLIHAWLYSTSPDASAPATPASPSALNALEKPDSLDEAESSIWDKLTAEFAPIALQVMDVSGGCGSMSLR